MLKKSLAFLLAMTMAFTTIPVHPAYAVEEPVEESDLAVMDEGEESEQQIGEWLELHYAYPNDCDQILPNRDMDITLWVGRVWYYSDDNQGAEEIEEYLIDITDVEGNPLENAIVDAEYTGNNTLHVSSMGSEAILHSVLQQRLQ